MKMIEDLFFGNYIPFEMPSINHEEWRELIRKLSEKEKPLRDSMTEEQIKLFEEYREQHLDVTISELRDAFIRGFRMGARVMLEVLEEEKYTVEG